jgi:hypothetical protein
MSTIGERLRAHWLARGVELPPGVTEDRLREFETRFAVVLPPDMRDDFLHVDGMGEPFQLDDDLLHFRSLSEVKSICDAVTGLEDPSSYFVFADHSIGTPTFAIQLTRSGTASNQVIAVDWDERGGLSVSDFSNSFGDFVERYLIEETWRERSPHFPEIDDATRKVVVKRVESLSTLTSFEKDVIKLRYGLSGEDTYTLDQICDRLGITWERVSEIERKAIEELGSSKSHTVIAQSHRDQTHRA